MMIIIKIIVKNCVSWCIITDEKAKKKGVYFKPIDKDDKPLMTYHVGPMELTKKAYNHILVLVDGFTNFVWLQPTKSTDSKSVIERPSAIFENPNRIISDRGTAFTAQTFEDNCKEIRIQHLLVESEVPRGNGQVERIHRIVVPLCKKSSDDDQFSSAVKYKVFNF